MFPCPTCKSPVEYLTTAKGFRYLADLSAPYGNGRRYSRGAHRDSCARLTASFEAMVAEQAEHDAKLARAAKWSQISVRWMAINGQALREWFAVDAEAAEAHLTKFHDRVSAGIAG